MSVPSTSTLSPNAQQLDVAMLAIDGAFASSICQPMDTLRMANALFARMHPNQASPFKLRLISAAGKASVQCSGGLVLGGIEKPGIRPDVLVVPGQEYRYAEDIAARAALAVAEQQLIRNWHQAGTAIYTSCNGAFLLAASGILAGKNATTSWWLAAQFKRQFPDIALDATAIYVEDQGVATAGAVSATFTMILKLIETHLGGAFAQNLSRILLIDFERQSQAAFVSEALLQTPRNPFSERAEKFVEKHLHEPELCVERLAQHLNMSTRSLIRNFQLTFHSTPQAYIQQRRMARAKALLELTALSLPEIVDKIGYRDPASFRKLFKRSCDVTPAVYRQRFSLRGR